MRENKSTHKKLRKSANNLTFFYPLFSASGQVEQRKSIWIELEFLADF